MSGKLVGEVIAACEAGYLDDLSVSSKRINWRMALVAIANRCHQDTRQGAVRTQEIAAAAGVASDRAARRIVAYLKATGRVRVVKHGYESPHGPGHPTVYELLELRTPRRSQAYADAQDTQEVLSTHHAQDAQEVLSTANMLRTSGDMLRTSGAHAQDALEVRLDGLYDGLNDDVPPSLRSGGPGGGFQPGLFGIDNRACRVPGCPEPVSKKSHERSGRLCSNHYDDWLFNCGDLPEWAAS